MKTSVKPKAQEVTLRQLAVEALEKADGNTTKAISIVVDHMLKDRHLLRELVAEFVLTAADAKVRKAQMDTRGTIMRSVGRADVQALAAGISAAILDFPLAGGLKLRDAKRADVMRQADFYETAGQDMTRKARWLRLIAQSVPEDKSVGDVLSDERAAELWKESSND